MKSKFFPALAVFVGTSIGAGFLGIPYVIGKSGFFIGLLWLIFIAAFIMVVKLYLGEVSLRTKGSHQLTGYAEKYLGKKGKILMFLAMLFGIFPALLAYLIAEGKSLSYVIFGNFSFSVQLTVLFWLGMAILTFIGLRALKKYEKIGMALVLLFVVMIFFFLIGKVDTSNFSYIGDNVFLPVGVILFSFLAFSSLPEVRRILFGQSEKMKDVIITGILISFIVYFIFSFVVVGVYGRNISEIATLSLGRFFSVLGILTIFTAFFTSSIAIRDMFRFDFNLGRFWGWILATLIPLALFLLVSWLDGLSFIDILGFAGVVSGGLTGVLVLLMNRKAKKLGDRKPEYQIGINWWIIILLSLIFIVGVVLELIF